MRGLRGAEAACRLALVTVAWTVLLGPALHLVGHRNNHIHGPGGAAHDHDHGDRHRRQPSASAAAERQGDQARPEQSPEVPDPRHGHGAGQHFGLSVLAAGPMLAPPPPAPTDTLAVPAASTQADVAARRGPRWSRGPPLTA